MFSIKTELHQGRRTLKCTQGGVSTIHSGRLNIPENIEFLSQVTEDTFGVLK